MKKLTLSNGEIRIGYEFNDLSEEAKEKANNDTISFLLDTYDEELASGNMIKAVNKSEKMQTPWFAGEYVWEYCKEEIKEMLEINRYLFNDEGEILPIMYHMNKNNEVSKITYGKKEYEVQITTF